MTREFITYWQNPLDKIIESVVTNNTGYETDHERFFSRLCRPDCQLELIDGTIISGQEHLDVHWHLRKLEEASVLPIYTESDRKLPLIHQVQLGLIEIS